MATVLDDQTGLIFEAVGMQVEEARSGSLKINRRPNRGEYVEVSVDEKRALPPFIKTLLKVNEDATLDFFVRLQEENDGEFPEKELVTALGEELAPFRGQIEYTGKATIRGDRFLRWKRNELLEHKPTPTMGSVLGNKDM